jgi:hypothetical protein
MYNEMVKSKPQVIEVLARNDWPHETSEVFLLSVSRNANIDS